MADSKISALSDAGTLASGDYFVIERGGSSNKKKALLGYPELVYRYTVTGSDKASIDTGVDTADAGTNDWTNGDVLEILVLVRTDEVAASGLVDIILNNDASAIYDRQNVTGASATASANAGNAESAWRLGVHGSGGSASYPGVARLSIPGFTSTTFWKVAEALTMSPDATAANQTSSARAFGYRSTSAITRVKLAAESTNKMKVGSQLIIYKRIAA